MKLCLLIEIYQKVLPDSYSEHVENITSLEPAQEHYHTYYTKAIE